MLTGPRPYGERRKWRAKSETCSRYDWRVFSEKLRICMCSSTFDAGNPHVRSDERDAAHADHTGSVTGTHKDRRTPGRGPQAVCTIPVLSLFNCESLKMGIDGPCIF